LIGVYPAHVVGLDHLVEIPHVGTLARPGVKWAAKTLAPRH
jgi:hypothetical protein